MKSNQHNFPAYMAGIFFACFLIRTVMKQLAIRPSQQQYPTQIFLAGEAIFVDFLHY
jgi:hypothetical protein